MLTRRIVYILFCLIFASFAEAQGITYYSKASGLAPNLLSNWVTNTNGTGNNPPDFGEGDVFIVQAGHIMTTTANWILDNINDATNTLSVTLRIDGTLVGNNTININDNGGGGNNVTLNSAGVYTDNTGKKTNLKNLFVNPNGSISVNGTVNINSAITGTNALNYSLTLYTLNLNANLDVTSGGSLTVNNSLSVNNGIVLDFNSTSSTLSNGSSSSFLTSGTNGKIRTMCTNSNPLPDNITWSGEVEYYGTSDQTVAKGTYYNLTSSGSGNKSLNGNVDVLHLLKIPSGTLNLTGHVVTLKSTSVSNTAQVDQVGGAINQSSGSFTVERYIPNGNRAYRDLGTIVYNASGTLFSNWQESGSTNPGYGTFITGKAGASAGIDAATGFDITQTGNPSMYSYINGSWTNGLTPTKSIILDPYQGFRTLVRGDRSYSLFTNPQPTVMNAATVLRTTGKIITGTVTYTSTGVTNTVANSSYHLHANNIVGYSMVANPYPAAIDWTAITKNGLVNRYYWYFDPTLGTAGAFVTYDAVSNTTTPTSNANQYIQSGQAFFVQGDGVTPVASQSLVITEAAKAITPSHTSVFGIDPVSINKIGVSLHKTVSGKEVMMDGAATVFSNNYSNTLNPNEDAFKLSNSSDNIAIARGSNLISIEARKPVASTDSVPIKLWTLSNNIPYTIKIDGTHFNYPNTITPYLVDKYLDTKTELIIGDTTKITFTPTSDTKTYLDRFVIVFVKNVAPALAIKLTAIESNYKVAVNWTSTNENKLSYYALERSTDGVHFSTISNFIPLNAGSSDAYYSYVDEDAPKTTNYYRIEAGNILDQVVFSTSAFVDLTVGNSKVGVYPNPITGNNFNLELDFMPAGVYTLRLCNQAGAIVQNQIVNHSGGRYISKTISLNQQLAKGIYVIQLLNNKNEVVDYKKVLIDHQ
jgi:hypothetical protein